MGEYHNFHYNLRVARGKATEFQCAAPDCERSAVEWAWDHTGPSAVDEIVAFGRLKEVRFGTDPERYVPMCKPCHVSFDRIADPDRYPCGHPRTLANSYVRNDGSRYCRECTLDYQRRHRIARP